MEKRNDTGACLCAVSWGKGARNEGASENKFTMPAQLPKSVKISINPSAPITGKAE